MDTTTADDVGDPLPVGEVGAWVREKHGYLVRYIEISRATRAKYLPPRGPGGATYIDLFCGPGKSIIRQTQENVDGSAIAAWRASVKSGTPFSQVYVCDSDHNNLQACVERLQRLGAPVTGYCLPASEAVVQVADDLKAKFPHGLHFAFIDPFSLEALEFKLIQRLSELKRIDLLIHLSAMDLQRNLSTHLAASNTSWDGFAPGWQTCIDTLGPQSEVRRRLVEYWRQKISQLGLWPSTERRLVTGDKGQPLYWLLMAARHALPHEFWGVASNPEGQGALFQ